MQSLESRVKSVFSSKAAKGLFASLALAAAANLQAQQVQYSGMKPDFTENDPINNRLPGEQLAMAPLERMSQNLAITFPSAQGSRVNQVNPADFTYVAQDNAGNKYSLSNFSAEDGMLILPTLVQTINSKLQSTGTYAKLPREFTIQIYNQDRELVSSTDTITLPVPLWHFDSIGASTKIAFGAIPDPIKSLKAFKQGAYTAAFDFRPEVDPDLSFQHMGTPDKDYGIGFPRVAEDDFPGSVMTFTWNNIDTQKPEYQRFLLATYIGNENNSNANDHFKVNVNGSQIDMHDSLVEHSYFVSSRGGPKTVYALLADITDRVQGGKNEVKIAENYLATGAKQMVILQTVAVYDFRPMLKTNPPSFDSDGDGFKDWDEIRLGMDAMNGNDKKNLYQQTEEY